MDGHQRANQHKIRCIQNPCNCKHTTTIINNNDTLRNNELQRNMNPSWANNNNYSLVDDEQTSRNAKIAQANQHLPVITLLVDENITKQDVRVAKDEKQETSSNSIQDGNFGLRFGTQLEDFNSVVVAANKNKKEEINEVQDLSIPSAKKQETSAIPQENKEAVLGYDAHLRTLFQYSEMNKAAISRMITNNMTQTLEGNTNEEDNANKRIENSADVMKMNMLYYRFFKLFHQSQTEVKNPTKDQYTQTDKNNNHKCSQTETQTNLNIKGQTNAEVVQQQLNSYINQNRVKYQMMGQNPTPQRLQNNQGVFLQEGMNASHIMTGQSAAAAGNAESAIMQAGLPYPYQPTDEYNANRSVVARHRYTTHAQHNNIFRSQNVRSTYQPNVTLRPQYRPYPRTQNSDWNTANNTSNYQNFQGYQNPYNNF